MRDKPNTFLFYSDYTLKYKKIYSWVLHSDLANKLIIIQWSFECEAVALKRDNCSFFEVYQCRRKTHTRLLS